MEVFVGAIILIGIGVLGMCFNIIFRKDGQFPQSDVGANENMRKMGIRCMREEDDEHFASRKKNNSGATCSGIITESCTNCGLYPKERLKTKKE